MLPRQGWEQRGQGSSSQSLGGSRGSNVGQKEGVGQKGGVGQGLIPPSPAPRPRPTHRTEAAQLCWERRAVGAGTWELPLSLPPAGAVLWSCPDALPAALLLLPEPCHPATRLEC